MHLYVEVKNLQAGIGSAIKSLSSRPTLPILEGIYLRARQDSLILRCSDLTLQIESIIPADVKEEGAVVLPGRLFSEMCRRLDGDTVEIKMDGKSVSLNSGRSRMTLQYTDAVDFPDMKNDQDTLKIEFAQSEIKNMIRQTSFATAIEESKPILTGVLCEINGTELNMVALDGFRLALRKTTLKHSHESMETVVPVKSLVELGRSMQDVEDTIELSFSKTHLALDMGHTKVITRLLDGDYIRYQSILPKEHKTRIRIKREELLKSIERAILLAREGNNNLVRFTIEENNLNVFANSALGRMEEDIEVSLNGEPIQIAFNARYFSDVLKALDDEEIYMDMNNNVSPCVLRPVQGEAYYYLILPVRIFS